MFLVFQKTRGWCRLHSLAGASVGFASGAKSFGVPEWQRRGTDGHGQ